MRLTGFRVTNFRSVHDSGWIDTGNVSALIGTNESGKTNLLLPLWKLNPAKQGTINPIADFPRKRYNEIRAMEQKPIFIEARFELCDELTSRLAVLTGVPEEQVRVAAIQRDFGGKYSVSFPHAVITERVDVPFIVALLSAGHQEIEALSATTAAEGTLKAQALKLLHAVEADLGTRDANGLDAAALREVAKRLAEVTMEGAPKRSTVAPRYGMLTDQIAEQIERVSRPHPNAHTEAHKAVLAHLPAFVYYSNYGNLDSEIYLPHVIDNMHRTGLGSREEAKARTLRVLFDFVGLQPEEIRMLGNDINVQQGPPTEAQIKEIAAKKAEREILLQSASAKLTERFRDWWKQGDYRFHLQADGDHFRIWVSDDKRPEEIELEGRSSGLQWFLSFYLIFLVESQEAHKGAILLLDEPGLSLHPLAQQDLSAFFENLSKTNQLLYTTHSPFLVDADHLDRVKAVYVDDAGATVASANLRAGEGRPAESRSVYPVHAALGLTVSQTLLQGCQPIIVEGPSDQTYLSAIKTYLIAQGRLNPRRELLFMPGGGRKGIGALVAILTGKEEEPPYVLLDSDGPGRKLAQELKASVYQGAPGRVLLVGDVCDRPNAEIEDLFPTWFLAGIIAKYLRGPAVEEDFDEVVADGEPIVSQVEAFAHRHSLALEVGWKVEVARRAKDRLLRVRTVLRDDGIADEAAVATWTRLFHVFEAEGMHTLERDPTGATTSTATMNGHG